MPFLPGYAAMPTTLLNAFLALTSEAELVMRGPDRLAVVAPMFDEEDGAGPALRSLLRQALPPDEIAISINGGTDRTPEVVAETLAEHGYLHREREWIRYLDVVVHRWAPSDAGPTVTVLEHSMPTSKSDGVNFVVAGGFVTSERVLIVDGDTRFHPDFVRELRDGFYRIRRVRRDGRIVHLVDDVGLQSGAVDSLRPGPGKPLAGAISRARSGEYAIAALLRSGQTRRIGTGRVFGSSRLYTAVGCGFAARRDAFPMPADTWTEDHDFTLLVQNEQDVERTTDADTLHERGFRVVVDGREISPRHLLDRDDEIVIRRTSGARFVSSAVMYTEDPPSLGGYLRQVERWNGGGIENALKRTVTRGAWTQQRPNVRFTVAAAQLENVLGLLLLLAVPAAVGVYMGAPGIGGLGVAGVGSWFLLDMLATLTLVYLGARRLEAAHGNRGVRRARRAFGTALVGVPPLLALRLFNTVSLVVAAIRVVPTYVKRAGPLPLTASRTWVRARARHRSLDYGRFALVGAALITLGTANFEASRRWAMFTWPDDRAVAALVADAPTIDQETHRLLPIGPSTPLPVPETAPTPVESDEDDSRVADAEQDAPSDDAGPRGATDPPPTADDAAWGGGRVSRVAWSALQILGGTPMLMAPTLMMTSWSHERDDGRAELSAFCPPSRVAAAATEPRALRAEERAYAPLTPWGLLTLARLAPLAAHLEQAATAYDVAPETLLKVVLNESYLDPLAVGPTNDLGLAQITTDTLTLLGALSNDPASPLANPELLPDAFSVFDPDFSLCAGSAMLAWATSQPGGDDEAIAYARYINPRHGVVRGEVSDRHRPLVDAFLALTPMVEALSATIRTYAADPTAVSPEERLLLDVAHEVAEGRIDIETAYVRVAGAAADIGIDDAAFYADVLTSLFGRTDLGTGPPSHAASP
mgnify:CR=1 FL=1